MQFCSNCGERVFSNASFCSACGSPVLSRPETGSIARTTQAANPQSEGEDNRPDLQTEAARVQPVPRETAAAVRNQANGSKLLGAVLGVIALAAVIVVIVTLSSGSSSSSGGGISSAQFSPQALRSIRRQASYTGHNAIQILDDSGNTLPACDISWEIFKAVSGENHGVLTTGQANADAAPGSNFDTSMQTLTGDDADAVAVGDECMQTFAGRSY